MFEKAKNDAENNLSVYSRVSTENTQVMVTVGHDYRPEQEITQITHWQSEF